MLEEPEGPDFVTSKRKLPETATELAIVPVNSTEFPASVLWISHWSGPDEACAKTVTV